MEPIAPHLPAVMGSLAGLVVAFVSLMAQVSPVTCVWRAVTAFTVFSAFGIVIRYLLGDADGLKTPQTGDSDVASNNNAIAGIEPGTPVDELLAAEERHSAESSR
jgi:hypothetical protein